MANKKVSQLVSKPSVLVTDLFPIADPTTGQLFKTTISDLGTAIGSGVSSVNGLVGAVVLDTDDIQELASPTNRWFTDTRARAALSASSPLAYNSGTGVFSIPQANGSTNGFLSSADWTTFNAKQAALSGTGFVKISGTTISYDNSTYLTTSAAASTYLALAGGTLTGALNGTSATFTGDLTLSATNPRLYFTDTDNNPDYFISNTDGTFTIYDVTNSTSRFTIGTTGNGTFGGNLTVAQIIRSGGTSAQFLKADGSVDSSTYLTTANAASNYVPYSGATATVDLGNNNLEINGTTTYVRVQGGSASGFISESSGSKMQLNPDSLILTEKQSSPNYTKSLIFRTTILTANYSIVVPNSSGTLALTSQLSAYLPLSGGTLTGALSGTSATFSGLTVENNQNGSTWVISKNTNAGAGAAAGFLMTNNTGDLGAISLLSSGNSPANGLFIRTLSTNSLILGTNSTANLTIASGGAATFSSSVTASGGLTVGSLGSGSDAIISLANNASGSPRTIYYKASTATINFTSTGGGDLVTITNGGSVGIGTTSPGTTLHVLGGAAPVIFAGNSTTFYTTYRYNTSTDVGYIGNGQGVAIGGGQTDFGFQATSNMLFAAGGGAERMRITSVGHIQTNGNPVYAYSGSISIGGTYQTIFAAVSGGVYLVSVTTDSADGTFGLLTVVNDPDKSLGMIYGNNISLQFSGDNVQMKSTNGSTYNTTWTATRLK